MNEAEKLEKRIDVLLVHLATNGKKVRQNQLKAGILDVKRLDAIVRIAKELMSVSEMVNELWENPECVYDVRI